MGWGLVAFKKKFCQTIFLSNDVQPPGLTDRYKLHTNKYTWENMSQFNFCTPSRLYCLWSKFCLRGYRDIVKAVYCVQMRGNWGIVQKLVSLQTTHSSIQTLLISLLHNERHIDLVWSNKYIITNYCLFHSLQNSVKIRMVPTCFILVAIIVIPANTLQQNNLHSI